ncbi:MAG TPA: NAD(P)-dependent oxidoreductase [Planctomycetota bacterium]|nr:NAD(P)-dependent oxidoreductase [Planctomycetota bacterium]
MKHETTSLPESIASVEQLETLLSQPTDSVVDMFRRISGDVIVLGVGGKMGPTLARMVRRATDAAGVKRRVIGVSRFGSGPLKAQLEAHGISTIACDLLDQEQLNSLPDVPNVIYMAALKFGSTGNEARTWAMNSYLPGMVSQKYRRSRIVAFSTGNVYGLAPVAQGGSLETDTPNPIGEYAISCLGRERIFEHFSRTLNIPMSFIRLNYATEMRYGVIVDMAQRVASGEPIDLTMGNCNAIWQADANAQSLLTLEAARTPPFVLNVTGPEILSVRRVALQIGALLGREVRFSGTEAPTSAVSNAQLSHRLYGYPRVSIEQVIRWTADWVRRGGENIGKPTHFEARDGKY